MGLRWSRSRALGVRLVHPSAKREGGRRFFPVNSVRARTVCIRFAAHARSALLAVLVQLLTNAITLEIGEIVDEQLPFQMIHLVLQAHPEHALEVALEEGTGAVLRSHPHPRGTLHLVEYPGDRKTPLLRGSHTLPREDLRVD